VDGPSSLYKTRRVAKHLGCVGPCANPATGSGKNDRWPWHAGDRIAVLSAGAYGMSMASNYNSRGRAAEVMVSGTAGLLIRDREKRRPAVQR